MALFLPKTGQLEKEIEKRKDFEIQILASKEEWEKTFDTIPDIILLIGRDQKIKNINKAAEKRFGGSRKEAMGEFCYEIGHGSEETPAHCTHTKTNKDFQSHTGKIYDEKLNGKITWLSTNDVPILGKKN